MKSLICLAVLLALLPPLAAQTADTAKKPAEKIGNFVINWDKLVPDTASKTGARRTVFNAPTDTLDIFHCHMSTLNPGESTGALHRHPQEELIILKEGTLEVNIDGNKQTATTGGMIFFAANANENMTNVGKTPATYYVIQFFTALTPKAIPAAPAAAK